MNRTWTVAWREFRHTVLTKAFVLGAIVAPLAFGVIVILIGIFLQPEAKPLVGRIAVVSPGEVLMVPLREALLPPEPSVAEEPEGPDPNAVVEQAMDQGMTGSTSVVPEVVDVELVATASADVPAVKDGIRSGDWTALLTVDEAALDLAGARRDNTIRVFVGSDSPPSHTELLESAATEAMITARINSGGLDPKLVKKVTARPRVRTIRMAEGGAEKTEIGDLRRYLPIAFMIAVWMATFVSGNYLLTSTIEEKSNRVMEVLLSAVSPMQLMAGKILGYAMVTTIMVAMFGAVLVAFLVLVSVLDLITPGQIVLLLIYLVMAYLMVSAIMAGIGSAVSDMRDAQTLLGPVSFAVMIPLFLSAIITEGPNDLVAVITTYVPPLTPFVMIMRLLATEPIAPLEIILSLVWGFGCALALVWIASRIFRVGVLMQGKPPSLNELVRWVRYR